MVLFYMHETLPLKWLCILNSQVSIDNLAFGHCTTSCAICYAFIWVSVSRVNYNSAW